jgi:ABC-type transporter Mla MlaB component
MSTLHALPSELTIYTVGEMLPQFKDWLTAEPGTLRIQASAVCEVDAAGVQLLLSLAKTLQAKDERLELVDASAGLTAACQALGVTGQLQWTSEGETHAH